MQEITIIRVLFVDDNEDLCRIFKLFLEGTHDFSVFTCLSAREGLDFLANNPVDAVISDYAMPVMDGLDFLKIIRQQYPDLPFIMLTGEDSKATVIEALNSGADFYQNKKDKVDMQILDIAKKVRVLVAQREAEKAIRRKDAILEAISYAADQFLKGTFLHIDSQDILGRLGTATGADLAYHVNIRECETEVAGAEIFAVWSRTGEGQVVSPSSWPERWHQVLTETRSLSCDLSSSSPEEKRFLEQAGIASILVLPIYANALMCGYLVFEDREKECRRSSIEIQTLIMAAEIIGSARYRRHIEEFYKSPVEEANLGIFLFCNSVFRYVNPRICSIFGYRREEMMRLKDPLMLIHPSDRDAFKEYIRRTMGGIDDSHHFECTGIRKDNQDIFLEIYLTMITLQDAPCIAGNVIDITDRRILQQSLQKSEQSYRRLAEQMDDLILVIDPSWVITYVNPAGIVAFSLHNRSPELDMRDLFREGIYARFIELVGESIEEGSIRSWSTEIPLPNLGNAWFDISITPVKIEEGEISSLVIYFHDVSSRVRREEEIRRTGLAQLELNMEQFQILNDEIRNPIQVIKGLNLLQGGEFADKIEVQLGIINELIDKLDRAWVQSEKVHKFLLRHYQHGTYMEKNPRNMD